MVILKKHKKILWIKSARIVFSLLILSNYGALVSEEELLKCETLSELEQNYELPDGQLKGETSFELKQNYELLDGKFITIDSERFRVSECMFKPNFLGLDLYVNIVMSGDITMYNGIFERVQEEIKLLLARIKQIYECVRKVLGLFIILAEATLYVFIGMYGDWYTLGVGNCVLIIIIFWVLNVFLNEVLQKGYGMDSGISSLIETNEYPAFRMECPCT